MQGGAMTLTAEDLEALERLRDAGALYEQYLRIADVGGFPFATDEPVYDGPPPTGLPLTLQVHIS